mgnify:CR=1 FL=1
MFATAFHTSRHYILLTAMACLCVLLGGPSYAAGAESLIIAGATYYEPGVSGPGWAWTDAGHLELNGYAGEAIGAVEPKEQHLAPMTEHDLQFGVSVEGPTED